MIRNILIDLDDTILDFRKAERIAVSKALSELDIEPEDRILDRYSELNLAQWKLLEQGKLARAEVKTRRFILLFEELGVQRSAENAALLYEGLLGVGHHFIDGAEELLQTLFGHYRLFIVSNGSQSVQEGRIKSAGIAKYFDGIFISEPIGYNKPDARFFEHCFSRIPGFKKEETAIVGDSLSSDIQGGKNAGITTIWFNPSHAKNDSEIFSDYETDELSKLPALIKGI